MLTDPYRWKHRRRVVSGDEDYHSTIKARLPIFNNKKEFKQTGTEAADEGEKMSG